MTSQVLSAADSKSIFFVKFSDLGYVCMLWGSFHHILSNVMALESFYSHFIDERCKIYSRECSGVVEVKTSVIETISS